MESFWDWLIWSASNNPATWISASAAVIAVLFSAITTVKQHSGRPSPYWICEILDEHANIEHLDPFLENVLQCRPTCIVEVINAGDGTAYEVQAKGTGCRATMLTTRKRDDGKTVFGLLPLTAVVKPNESMYFLLFCEGSNPNIGISLLWLNQPTRLRRRAWQLLPVEGRFPNVPQTPIPLRSTKPEISVLRYRLEHSRIGRKLYNQFHWLYKSYDRNGATVEPVKLQRSRARDKEK